MALVGGWWAMYGRVGGKGGGGGVSGGSVRDSDIERRR